MRFPLQTVTFTTSPDWGFLSLPLVWPSVFWLIKWICALGCPISAPSLVCDVNLWQLMIRLLREVRVHRGNLFSLKLSGFDKNFKKSDGSQVALHQPELCYTANSETCHVCETHSNGLTKHLRSWVGTDAFFKVHYCAFSITTWTCFCTMTGKYYY